jgi:farnesyl diphosphate synthase
MNGEAAEWISGLAPRIEHALHQHLPLARCAGSETLNDALRYAVFNGGKRMRPLLALTAAALTECDEGDALRIAAAMEYLHTASLILDDLPAMDDSAERRGMPSVHVRFGEGVALLAAMALLNQTYALLADCHNGDALVALACECIGHRGMVAGQALDLAAATGREGHAQHDHYLKTTALFRLAMLGPALAAASGAGARDALAEYGRCAGMAYQLIDDAHDLEIDLARQGAWADADPAELRDQAQAWAARAGAALREAWEARAEVRFLEAFARWLLEGAQAPRQLTGGAKC